LFGNVKGRLSTGGNARMYWGSNGISTNDSDYWKYSKGTFTPSYGLGGVIVYGDRSGFLTRNGRNVTVAIEIQVTVTGGAASTDVYFTGPNLANPLAFWQRCNVAQGVVTNPILIIGPFNFTVKNGSSNLNLVDGLGVPVQSDGAGGFTGAFYSTYSFIGPDV
jgi:hypothetical protein